MKAVEETYLTQVVTCYGKRQYERMLEIVEGLMANMKKLWSVYGMSLDRLM